jgi:hypothetical protein
MGSQVGDGEGNIETPPRVGGCYNHVAYVGDPGRSIAGY